MPQIEDLKDKLGKSVVERLKTLGIIIDESDIMGIYDAGRLWYNDKYNGWLLIALKGPILIKRSLLVKQ